MPESQLPLRVYDAPGSSFGNTEWWVVGQAGRPEQDGADQARARLCQTYWAPVFRYIRGTGRGFHDAEDLTQEFFARLLEKNWVHSADREKGKFRSFLLTLLKRFLADQQDRDHCQKRGGLAQPISLDSGDTEFRRRLEPIDEQDPGTICEREWLQARLEQVLSQLERECAAEGQGRTFDGVKPLVTREGEDSYATVAARLRLTEANVKVTVYRLRQRLRQLLSAALAG